MVFHKVHLDVKYMTITRNKTCFVAARDDFTGWIEARALTRITTEAVATFLWEDVITRHGIFGKLVVDGGSENKKYVEALTLKYGIKRVVVSAYNPQANGVVERGHKPIADSLVKLQAAGYGDWVSLLPLVLWADRTTTRQSTGVTPYRLLYGYECVLPIETRVPTWSTVMWDKVSTTAELLTARAIQLAQRDLDLEEAASRLQRKRELAKEYWDEAHSATARDYEVGDIVVVYNSRFESDFSLKRKLAFWWLGPYKIREAHKEKGTYILEELDGTLMDGTYAGRRLKIWHSRAGEDPTINTGNDDPLEAEPTVPVVPDPEEERLPSHLQKYVPAGQPFAVVIPPHPSFE